MVFEKLKLPEVRRVDVLKVFAEHKIKPTAQSKDDLIDELVALDAAGKLAKPKKE